MFHIFLEDVITKVTRRGAVSNAKYYNIIIPELSNGVKLILKDKTEVYAIDPDVWYWTEEIHDTIYKVRAAFSDYFKDENLIKHSFHKNTIDMYDDDNNIIKVDLYFNNKSLGFENIQRSLYG